MPGADGLHDEIAGAESLTLPALVFHRHFTLQDVGVAGEGMHVARQACAGRNLHRGHHHLWIPGRQDQWLADGRLRRG